MFAPLRLTVNIDRVLVSRLTGMRCLYNDSLLGVESNISDRVFRCADHCRV